MLPHPEVTPVIAPVFYLKAGVGTGSVLCGQKEEPEEPLNHKTGSLHASSQTWWAEGSPADNADPCSHPSVNWAQAVRDQVARDSPSGSLALGGCRTLRGRQK